MTRPLSELEALSPRLRGIFTDIDDTLTHEGVLVPAAYAAIARAHAAGLKVVPMTGRPAGWAAVLAATWPVDAVVAENGAVACFRSGRAVEMIFFDDEASRARAQAALETLRAEVLDRIPRAKVAGDQWLRLTDLAFDVGETQTLAQAEIDALAACIEDAGARAQVSTVHAHASYSAADKAKMAVRIARARFGVDLEATRDEWLFVGDSPNDQAGFAFFPLSAGPANVARFAGVLDPGPSFIAPSPGGHGFAEIAGAVLARR